MPGSPTTRILPGDCRARLADLPAESVHCVVTSPPYYGLRSYDERAVRIDPSLDPETQRWVMQQLEERGIDARL